MVGFYIKNPVFSSHDLNNPISIQLLSEDKFYLNPTFYSYVELLIKK